MSDISSPDNGRCPHCDAVLDSRAGHCLLCGATIKAPAPAKSPAPAKPAAAKPEPPPKKAAPTQKATVSPPNRPLFRPLPTAATKRPRPQYIGAWLGPLIFTVVIALAFVFVWQNQAAAEPTAVADITPTPSPSPTVTAAHTLTPEPTATDAPSLTPTITPTPAPTDTPQPPRVHRVRANETLYGLAFTYSVSVASITELNELGPNQAIRVDEDLLIPWPTPTPPLAPIAVEIRGETIIADPTDCEQYVIQSGDNLFAVAANLRIPLVALQQVNRLTDQSLIRPGDTLCIPRLIRGGILPPTPGPSPTPTMTLPPPGPQLLFPPRDATITHPDGPGMLQWAHVKALMADEYYMVELVNLSHADSRPYRAFTRDTAVRIPLALRPESGQTELFRWRVTIVRVTGQRADGQFTYTYGGNPSIEALFYWQNTD
jgi:LysM repeat protein